MAITLTAPIFPGFSPGHSYTPPGYPVRGPSWDIKKKDRWNNFRQQSVNGKMLVVKYWPNPLWSWEWTYDVIIDDYTRSNSYYNLPIPYTDFQILQGFHAAMQGGGNIFLYQPDDFQVGGSLGGGTISSVQVTSNLVTLIMNNSAGLAVPGLYMIPSGLSGGSFLNGQTIQILSISGFTNPATVVIGPFSHANYGPTSDSGSCVIGQKLATVDSNNNTELVHMIGGYPTLPLSGSPSTMNQVTESVQVMDTTGFNIFANGVSAGGTFSLSGADAVYPYAGIVAQFGSPPTDPLIAAFKFYYPCRFTEDEQEWENFVTMLWATKSFKFEQIRI